LVSRGDDGSKLGMVLILFVGVSSLSLTRTQLLGLRKVAPDLSVSIGVDILCDAVNCVGLSSAFLEDAVDFVVAEEAVLRESVAETRRFGTFIPNSSFVAFSLACNSCNSLKPLVFTTALGLTGATRAGEPMTLCRCLDRAGDAAL